MKFVIVDANNVSNIAFYQAKSVMLRERSAKIKEIENLNEIEQAKLNADRHISENLTSFAVNIFLNIIHRYFKDNKNATFLFVWDGRNGTAWRKEENSNYKSNRDHSAEKNYDSFIESTIEEKRLLDEYPVIQFKDIEAEADDLIYNLCRKFENDDVKVISGDSDFIQLPQKFKKTKIWNPRTKKYY